VERRQLQFLALAVAALTSTLAGVACAHGGGLNSEGCHTERKTGDYHCHGAPAVQPASQSPTAGKTGSPPPKGATPAAATGGPKCYVGPRGGTYTLTASGRKNYGGC
jgi:hypothetical protein